MSKSILRKHSLLAQCVLQCQSISQTCTNARYILC